MFIHRTESGHLWQNLPLFDAPGPGQRPRGYRPPPTQTHVTNKGGKDAGKGSKNNNSTRAKCKFFNSPGGCTRTTCTFAHVCNTEGCNKRTAAYTHHTREEIARGRVGR